MTEHQIDNSVILSEEDHDCLIELIATEEAEAEITPEVAKTLEHLKQNGYSNFKCYPDEGGYLAVNLDTPNGKDSTFMLNAKTGVIEAVYD